MTAMWTEPQDVADPGQATARAGHQRKPSTKRRGRPYPIGSRRPLCEHGGYAGTDPLTGRILCAICRKASTAGRPA